jgi:hypothetical protein
MVSEIEHTRAVNTKAWSFLFKKFSLPFTIAMCGLVFSVHCDLHYKERAKTFYNRSKMFGDLKNPQY